MQGRTAVVTRAGRVWSRFQGSSALRALALGVLLCAVALVAVTRGHPFWLTNDDLTMSWIASGRYTGSPSAQLGFVSQILGLPISWAYGVADVVPWYPMALLGTVVLSLSLMALAVTWRVFLGWVPLAIALTVWCALRPNFTVTALIAASVGVALAVEAIGRGRFPWIGLGLFVLGVGWRSDAGVVALIALIPLFAFAWWESAVSRRWWSFAARAAALPIGALAVARVNSMC